MTELYLWCVDKIHDLHVESQKESTLTVLEELIKQAGIKGSIITLKSIQNKIIDQQEEAKWNNILKPSMN